MRFAVAMRESELVFGHKDSNVTKSHPSYKIFIKILIAEVDKIDKYTLHDDATVLNVAKDILRKTKLLFKRLLDDGNTKTMSDKEKLDQVISMLKRRLRDNAEDPGILIEVSNISRYDVVLGRGGNDRHRETNKLFERVLKALVDVFKDDYNQASRQEKNKIVSELRKLVEDQMKEINGKIIRFIIRRRKQGETEYYVASSSYMRGHFQKRLSEKRSKKRAKDESTFPVGSLEDTGAKQRVAEETKGDSTQLSELYSKHLDPVPFPVENSYWSEADINLLHELFPEVCQGTPTPTMDDFDQLVAYKDVFHGEFDPSNLTSLDELIGDFEEGTSVK